jgi:hypothetical protein
MFMMRSKSVIYTERCTSFGSNLKHCNLVHIYPTIMKPAFPDAEFYGESNELKIKAVGATAAELFGVEYSETIFILQRINQGSAYN